MLIQDIFNGMKDELYRYNRTILEDYENDNPIFYVCDYGSGLSSLSQEMSNSGQAEDYGLDFTTLYDALRSEVRLLLLHITEMHKHYATQVIDVDYCQEEYDYSIECPEKLIEIFERTARKLEEL